MYVIHHHNEHHFDNPGMCQIIGPYETIDQAKAALERLVEESRDRLFCIDPNPDADCNDRTYAGYYYQDLIDNGRNEDLASEIWAEIVKLTPPSK